MAYQGDPNRERHRMLQREDGSLKVIPIVLGVVFLLFVGYKLWPHHSTVPRSTTKWRTQAKPNAISTTNAQR
jgi:hypothetical protein